MNTTFLVLTLLNILGVLVSLMYYKLHGAGWLLLGTLIFAAGIYDSPGWHITILIMILFWLFAIGPELLAGD